MKRAVSGDADIDADESLGRGTWHLVRSHGRTADALVRALKARADIAEAEPNYHVHLSGMPDDLVTSLWALQNTGQVLENGDRGTAGADIGAVRAWDVSTGSRQAVVAAIDTGIMAAHQDLAANLWTAPHDFTVTIAGQAITCAAGTHGFNAVARTCDPADDNGHGTHVAGSIGAAGNNAAGVVGVNWTASIMAVKFLDASGNGFISDAINGIEFAIQAKQAFASSNGANVRVLNNSWDGGDYSQALADEIQRAAEADMLFVAAAGNHSSDNGATAVYPAGYGLSNVVSVAATDYRDQLAAFSDYSATAVHVAAPGSFIYSTSINTADPSVSAYQTMSGTSMATAYVSGAAALVLSHCTYSTGALRDALLSSATSLASLGGKVQSSRRLNAVVAVRSCDAAPSSQPENVVVYASDVPPANIHGAWSLQPDATAAGGAKLATPDNGVANTTAPLASPADYVDVPFSAPAGLPYHVWLRLRATSDSKYNDSVYAQFSDALVNGSPAYGLNSSTGLMINLENCSGCGVAGWGWQDGAYWLARAAVVSFASGGAHTLRVQVREDGVAFDQVVLSPTTWLSSSPGQVASDGTIVAKPPASGSTSSSGTPSPYGGSAAAVPGTIEAENFDTGGEGAGYHDTTVGNSGGAYRQADVDLEPASGGGYDVGWAVPGEWLRYSIDVAQAGNYTVRFRVASAGQGGTFHLETNGANLTGALTVPNTGGWQSWQTVTANVTLPAGAQAARLVMDSAPSGAVGNFDSFVFAAASAPAGTSAPLTIGAADYDHGGEGVSYHDTTAGNSGGASRQDDVDVEASSDGGYDVGWIAAGEWLNYTVNIPAAASYTVSIRVASPSGGGAFHAGFNTTSNVWKAVAVPATGSWQTWTTITIPVTLGAGQQQLTILCDRPGYNIGKITIAQP